jgi:hypothetical protein
LATASSENDTVSPVASANVRCPVRKAAENGVSAVCKSAVAMPWTMVTSRNPYVNVLIETIDPAQRIFSGMLHK